GAAAGAERRGAGLGRARGAGRRLELARVEQRLGDAGEAAGVADAAVLAAQRLGDGAAGPALEPAHEAAQAVEVGDDAAALVRGEERDLEGAVALAGERQDVRAREHGYQDVRADRKSTRLNS